MSVDDHFNQTVDMVKLGNGSFRQVEIFRLSRMACMIIAENADWKAFLCHAVKKVPGLFGDTKSFRYFCTVIP